MRTPWTCLVGATLLSGAFACSSAGEEKEAASAAHTQGDDLWTNAPQGWAEVDRQAFDGIAYGRESAPDDHLTTTRVQAWLDRYDAIVRSIARERGITLVAPRPRARISVAWETNAYVFAAPACIAATTTPPTALPDGASGLLRLYSRTSSFPELYPAVCLEAKNWSAAAALSWFNGLGGLQVVPNGPTFSVIASDGTRSEAGKIAINAIVQHVTVNTGLIENLSERAAAVILAHELGHYYRLTGATAIEGQYDFWYQRAEHLPERPLPAADQAALAAQYESLKLPRLLVPGQRFHPRVAGTLLRWTSELFSEPGHACEPAQQAFAALPEDVKNDLFTSDDHVRLQGTSRQALLALEEKLATCLNAVELDEAPDDGAVYLAGSPVSRAWFTNRIDSPFVNDVPAEALASARSLRQVVDVLEATGRRLDEQVPEFLKQLADNRIGHYTTEQEADELSMELAVRVGITPDEVVEAYLELGEVMEREDPSSWLSQEGMTASQCRDLVTSGFRDGASERKIYVAMGGITGHHAHCYRLFNLQRERDAHAYVTASPRFEPSATPWEEIQAAARALAPPK